jgi:hypothetical protein
LDGPQNNGAVAHGQRFCATGAEGNRTITDAATKVGVRIVKRSARMLDAMRVSQIAWSPGQMTAKCPSRWKQAMIRGIAPEPDIYAIY